MGDNLSRFKRGGKKAEAVKPVAGAPSAEPMQPAPPAAPQVPEPGKLVQRPNIPRGPKMLDAATANDQRRRLKGRIPDGSRYDVTYDGATQSWAGTLTVPGIPPFYAQVNGVFSLLESLDNQYREHTRTTAPLRPAPAQEEDPREGKKA